MRERDWTGSYVSISTLNNQKLGHHEYSICTKKKKIILVVRLARPYHRQ